MSENDNKFEKHYSEDGFWEKVKKFAKKAGYELIEKALWLYYAAQEPETPGWAKSIIYGALGYFILPLDVLPDPIFVDDLGILIAAISAVSFYITPNVKNTSKKKLKDWFGDDDGENELTQPA